ncbi:MAG: glucan biosynthesis protein [Loktanella sp.]|nr:glucan biosynthesis protein [Loktanella sp.]
MARLSRRMFLGSSVATLALLSGHPVAAQSGEGEDFSFDALTESARAAATDPYEEPVVADDLFSSFDYDDYRMIRFRTERARWADTQGPWRLHAFHTGWLFGEPVSLFEIVDGKVVPMTFTTRDFEYLGELADRVPAETSLPGVAGFRLNGPLNHPARYDEIVSFLGASYFRALGRDNRYGLSARGLAVNTAGPEPEEFPRFSEFYIARDPQGGPVVTIYARLDGPSVTINRADYDDYRPRVHDSDGLRIVQQGGDVLWRPLNNPDRLSGAYFSEQNLTSFGLHQRARGFDAYQDASARYDLRPSLEVEPIGDWGPGFVRLVEIPTDLEVNDNIVAYFIPDGPVAAGDAREFSYRLRWGDLLTDPTEDIAHVVETRAGAGGVSGVEAALDERKFVVDFDGGVLSRLSVEDQDSITPVVTVSGGDLVFSTLEPIDEEGRWRMVVDVRADAGAIVELSAHVAGFGRKLSEVWVCQWVVANA